MLVQTVVSGAFLLTTTLDPVQLAQSNCLSDSYYGTFGIESVFILDSDCNKAVQSMGTVPLNIPADSELAFIYSKDIDPSLGSPTLDFNYYGSQSTFNHQSTPYSVLHQSQSSALIAVDKDVAHRLDTFLPRFFKSIPIPSTPIPLLPVPSKSVDIVRNVLRNLKFDPAVASIVNNISVPQMRNDIRYLTGEDPRSPIVSRHSFSEGSRIAALWLKDRFEDAGARCELREFLTGFAPDVICRYRSTVPTTGTVIIGGHYDSRGSFGNTRAPGGNDDGSGITALLSIAHTIARKHIAFKSNVELVAFAGEEQGLYGSRAYARDLRAENANITLMIQADMLAYHAPGEPPQLGLPAYIGTPEAAHLVGNITTIYSPELTVGITSACCSDHQSFHEQGFPATHLFERAGPIADPMYHNSGDLSEREGFDFYQLRSIAKVEMATLLHTAGYEIRH